MTDPFEHRDLRNRKLWAGTFHGVFVNEIQDREQAASPAPWYFDGPRQMVIDENGRSICKVAQWGPHGVRVATVQDYENGKFIAASRNDVEVLLALVSAMRKELADALNILGRVSLETDNDALHDDIALAATHYGWWEQ